MHSQNNLPRTPVLAKRFLGSGGRMTTNQSFDLYHKHGFNGLSKQTTGVLNQQSKSGMAHATPSKSINDKMFSKTPADKGSKSFSRIILPQFKKISSERNSTQASSSNKIDLPTHQEKYSGFQVTPIVRLTAVNKPTFYPKEKQGVRVWIAPPDSLRTSRLSVSYSTTKDDTEDKSVEILAPYETACLEFLRKKRKLFGSPEINRGSENQSSETEKPVTFLNEGSDLLRDEEFGHPSKRRKIVESTTLSTSLQAANVHKRPALRDSDASECMDESNSEAKRQKLDHTLPKIWDSFRNPIEVSHLSMKKFFERKAQASKSRDYDAGSLRSSRESSVQTDEDCLGTSVQKLSAERTEQGDRLCQTPSENHSIREESGSFTPVGDSASEVSRLSKVGGGGSIRRRLALPHLGSPLNLKKSEQPVRQGVTWKDLNEDRKRYYSRLHPLLDEGNASSGSIPAAVPTATVTFGVSSSVVSSNSNESSVLEKANDITTTILSVKPSDEKDSTVLTNKLESPQLHTTSSDKPVDSAVITTTSPTITLSQNQEKDVLPEKTDVIRDSGLNIRSTNNSSVESLKKLPVVMSNQGQKIEGVKDDHISMKNVTSESLQLKQSEFQSVVTTTGTFNLGNVLAPSFNFSTNNSIGEKGDAKAIFSFQSQDIQSERPKYIFDQFVSSAVSTGSESLFVFSSAPATSVPMPASQSISNPFGFNNQGQVTNNSSTSLKSQSSTISSSFVFQAGGSNPLTITKAPEKTGDQIAASNMFSFQSLTSSHQKNGFGSKNPSIISQTSMQPTDSSSKSNALFSAPQPSMQFSSSGFQASAFSRATLPQSEAAPKPMIPSSFTVPTSQQQINQNPFSFGSQTQNNNIFGKTLENSLSSGVQQSNQSFTFGKSQPSQSFSFGPLQPIQNSAFGSSSMQSNFGVPQTSQNFNFGIQNSSQTFGMSQSQNTAFAASQLSAKTQSSQFATSQQNSIFSKSHVNKLSSATESQKNMFGQMPFQNINGSTFQSNSLKPNNQFQQKPSFNFQAGATSQATTSQTSIKIGSEAVISNVNENKPYQFSATPQFNFSAVANNPISENKGSSFPFAATQPAQGLNFNAGASQFPSFGGGGSFTLGAANATKTTTANRARRKPLRR